jgi:hypothetical protein
MFNCMNSVIPLFDVDGEAPTLGYLYLFKMRLCSKKGDTGLFEAMRHCAHGPPGCERQCYFGNDAFQIWKIVQIKGNA